MSTKFSEHASESWVLKDLVDAEGRGVATKISIEERQIIQELSYENREPYRADENEESPEGTSRRV